MKRYSKAIAGLVGVVVSFLVVQFPGIDGAGLEGSIMALITTVTVIFAPANG